MRKQEIEKEAERRYPNNITKERLGIPDERQVYFIKGALWMQELSMQEVSGQIPDECLQQQSCDYPVGSCKKCTPKAAKQEPRQGWTDIDMIDFHNFIFRHENQGLKMGEYLKEFKSLNPKQ
jgi:hypothetical protein